jgi:AraC-like DNA-binding protein
MHEARLRHFATVLGFSPCCAASSLSEAFDRCSAALFEDAPESISGTIRSLRLERSARDLAQPHGPTIMEVALRWGFNDSSHFSRLFKRRFGVCPREFRAAAVQGA